LKGVCILLPLKEKALMPTSSGFKRIVNLNCLFLLLLIKMNESLKRTKRQRQRKLKPNLLNRPLKQCPLQKGGNFKWKCAQVIFVSQTHLSLTYKPFF
jgi:hypothetical protein